MALPDKKYFVHLLLGELRRATPSDSRAPILEAGHAIRSSAFPMSLLPIRALAALGVRAPGSLRHAQSSDGRRVGGRPDDQALHLVCEILGIRLARGRQLFAYRTTSPNKLRTSSDPLGSRNDHWLSRLQGELSLIIAAWGDHGRLLGRSSEVSSMLPSLHILGLTLLGEPRHPLYVKSAVRPLHWSASS